MANTASNQAASPAGTDVNPATMSPFSLELDPHNPRLVEFIYGETPSQVQLIRVLWENMAVDELVMSISASGYFSYEPLFVVREGGQNIVIEGNRRLAALKLMLDPELRKEIGALGFPKLNAKRRKSLEAIPVIWTERIDAWQYIGFKHVNGPVKWDSYPKAQYIARVHNNYHVTLDDIAIQIGDKHRTVQRLYRALMVIEQAERNKLTAYAHGSGRESLPPDVEVEVRAGERVERSLYVPADGATT